MELLGEIEENSISQMRGHKFFSYRPPDISYDPPGYNSGDRQQPSNLVRKDDSSLRIL